MNWYKKAQYENITYEQVVRAIDQFILEEDLLTEEDFIQAWNTLYSGEEYGVKTAQRTQKNKKKIIELINNGVSVKRITEMLGVRKSDVFSILHDKYETPGLKKRVDKMIGDQDDAIKPTVPNLSKILKVPPIVLKRIFKNWGIDTGPLVNQRKKRNAIVIVKIVDRFIKKGQKYNNTIMRKAFEAETGFSVSENTIRTALSSNNRFQRSNDTVYPAITGIERAFYEKKNMNPAKFLQQNPTPEGIEYVNKVIDDFILENGHNFDFDVSKVQDVYRMKELMMTKMQIRDLMYSYQEIASGEDKRQRQEQKRNFQPDFTGGHPSGFIADRENSPNYELV
jgi:hypothetical protein